MDKVLAFRQTFLLQTGIMTGDGNVVFGSDIARSRSMDRKIGDLQTGGGSNSEGQTSMIRGVRFQDLDSAGKTIGSGGTDIVHSAEVRVARPLHCWDCVLNPGQTSLIRGDWSQDLNTAGKTIGSGAGLPTELKVNSVFSR